MNSSPFREMRLTVRSRLGVALLTLGLGMAGPISPLAAIEAGDIPEVLQAGAGFSDIEEAGGHRNNIEMLAARGILDGTECAPEKFCPDDPIQRWVMAVWLVRALDGAEPGPVGSSRFADVDSSVWWSPYLERLADLGITRGCAVSPARFCPTEPVDRQQMASFLVRAFSLEQAPGNRFIDVWEGNSHLVAVNALAEAGVTAGCATQPARYCPTTPTTRAQMATFLARALGIATPRPGATAQQRDYAEVAAGWTHSCALRTDGTIVCWGANWWGQAEPPQGHFTTISVGGEHSCGIRTSGTVACWGSNNYGQAEPPQGHFTTVTAGGEHSCGIRTSGTVACWGSNNYGQADAAGGKFKAVAAGNRHTCALGSGGSVSCWGSNDHGEATPPAERFVSVSVGTWHSCGITTDRTVACWGGGWDGQTGPPPKAFASLESGWEHSCGIDTEGAVACWGYNGDGQANVPEGIFVDVTAGDKHSCGIATDHTLVCWGRNTEGTPLPRQSGFTTVEAGERHACALQTDGGVQCWGDYQQRRLDAPTGALINLSVGDNHSCGVRTDGTLVCWGVDWVGQASPPEGEFTAVAAGRSHSCGIHADHTVTCWGWDQYGKASPPTGEFRDIVVGHAHSCGLGVDGTITCWGDSNRGITDAPRGEFTSMAAGSWHSCAIATDGSLACWGHQRFGKSQPPGGTFVAVAAGRDHSCAVRTDHTVVCWGINEYGRAGAPGGSFTDVAAALSYSCATRTNGTIACWGRPLHQRTPSGVGHLAIETADRGAPAGDLGVGSVVEPSNPQACRLPGPTGFSLPSRAVASTGTARVVVLFMDFADAEATLTTAEEAELGLPYMREYLKATSYGKFDVEFSFLHRWLRAEHNHDRYTETSVFGTPVLGQIQGEAIRLADPEVDFGEYDSVMVIMPGSHFHGGSAGGTAISREGRLWNFALINPFPHDEQARPPEWGAVGAHELLHNLGLPDLYSYAGITPPDPPGGKMWVRANFGVMGMVAHFPVSEGDPRMGHVWRQADGGRYLSHAYALTAGEMLAWSRWQLGWLEPDQVHCLTGLDAEATITLNPVARPGNGIAMIAIPVSGREAIIVESRRRLSYDAGADFVQSDNLRTVIPALAEEGVLVYTVNAALGSGRLPIRIAGDPGNGYLDEYPLLTSGESVTVRGYTIKVQSASSNADTITITRNPGS